MDAGTLIIIVLIAFEIVLSLTGFNLKRKPDINCDNCKRPMLLKQTPDKSFWLCKTCMKAYKREQAHE
jgi:ribosomal protein L37AE/L43A